MKTQMQRMISQFESGHRMTTLKFQRMNITSPHRIMTDIRRLRPDLGIDSVRIVRNGKWFNCYIPYGVK